MADPYIGEIRLFAGNFAPRGWALCNGQLMSITQNTALYSILGTQYGGDGRTTFALPDFRGRVPVHQGAGLGLTPRQIGQSGGSATVTLWEGQIPAHSHVPNSVDTGTATDPTGAIWSNAGSGRTSVGAYSGTPNVAMNPQAIATQGSSLPHNNAQPYVALNFIIATQGLFPGRD